MIEFKPLHKDDLQLLYQWFQEPTINQQYARGQTWSLNDIEINTFQGLIVMTMYPALLFIRIINLLDLFNTIACQSIIQKVFKRKVLYLKTISQIKSLALIYLLLLLKIEAKGLV